MENIIKIEEICKSFGEKDSRTQVLNNISLTVGKGEFISLMGASGSGKSTLLYLIGGLDTPDSGEIFLDGRDISKMRDKELSKLRREGMGFVFQFFNLVQNLTVEDNILLPLVMDGKSPKKYRDRLDSILETVGLSDKRRSYPNQLSGGQQQRCAIARAVIYEPKILLADEPTGNLDSKSGTEIMELFSRINKEKGITILMVTHSAECAAYSDRIITLSDGKILP
ncbi:putative ABC transport system ATP-binding protein [Ruminococcus flavefaciens]|uniref:Putative ABC transport system ATP-binding protein n=1 Tax=Ruminococcus flavefaciens TaxID=1265 RepID=A0A1H6K3E4_RUMFL|nr:ABC transporter ATP-binding protein [Ruminococcus flavefaciens]SEH69639.1 putative ABC transport system ATP-binding protein [Ruminococcus flavefaciens]